MQQNFFTGDPLYLLTPIAAIATALCCPSAAAQTIDAQPGQSGAGRVMVAVHGGSGTITRGTITPEIEANYRAALDRALKAGHAVLVSGGSSADAVVATIKVFEDDPLFNAGKGAVFTNEGKNELDASIMDGKTGLAGAVAGVTTVKNPITAARAVMDKIRRVLMASSGADKFAAVQKLNFVAPDNFYTPQPLRPTTNSQRA